MTSTIFAQVAGLSVGLVVTIARRCGGSGQAKMERELVLVEWRRAVKRDRNNDVRRDIAKKKKRSIALCNGSSP